MKTATYLVLATHATVFTVFRQLRPLALIIPSYFSPFASTAQGLFCKHTSQRKYTNTRQHRTDRSKICQRTAVQLHGHWKDAFNCQTPNAAYTFAMCKQNLLLTYLLTYLTSRAPPTALPSGTAESQRIGDQWTRISALTKSVLLPLLLHDYLTDRFNTIKHACNKASVKKATAASVASCQLTASVRCWHILQCFAQLLLVKFQSNKVWI